eukprot:TRINITY_DN94158_c0_g1_i1.p1 TRINITY_DN94158_c0_g1~~TRINITY_DN94158_c0_g1_i1.p1  ORF type:complete len:136 (+),score=14.45 TRINITY_DN94158_c0_g1_i1:95-502(+)
MAITFYDIITGMVLVILLPFAILKDAGELKLPQFGVAILLILTTAAFLRWCAPFGGFVTTAADVSGGVAWTFRIDLQCSDAYSCVTAGARSLYVLCLAVTGVLSACIRVVNWGTRAWPLALAVGLITLHANEEEH